jgi:outer membrane protein
MEMQNKFQQDQTYYAQNRDSMSPLMRQTKEESLQTQAQKLQERQQQFEQRLQTYQMSLTNPLFKKVEEEIAKIAKEKGFTYVIDLSTAVYAGGTDLTDLVIERLGLQNISLPQQQVLPGNPAAGGQMGAPGQGY